MIFAKPTEHLAGITLEGEYQDFYEIVESIYRMTGLEESYDDYYWSVKNRLLGLCYDVRHAYQGDRNVKLIENGVNEELMKWHSKILPKNNVHYSVEILFPEAVFVALAVPELYILSSGYYGPRSKKQEEKAKFPAQRYSDYLRDQAILDWLSTTILQALADVIGDDELAKLLRFRGNRFENHFSKYATQYIDKCNIDYLKTAPEKRKDKLRNIAKRIVQKPAAYETMKRGLEYSAKELKCSIYDLYDPRQEYPENIEW